MRFFGLTRVPLLDQPCTLAGGCQSTGEPDVTGAADSTGADANEVHQSRGNFVDDGDGTITDTCTGLVWQETPDADSYPMCTEAIDYDQCPAEQRLAEIHCQNNDDGLPGTDWRLPTIGELRSLIVGCSATGSNGACNVSEATGGCLKLSCRADSCEGCSGGEGEGQNGFYIDLVFNNRNFALSWSSSPNEDSPGDAWGVNFDNGKGFNRQVYYAHDVRCVRSGP